MTEMSGISERVPNPDRKACPERGRRVYQSPDYKEEQLRAEFLNPFFESLGWDVANKAGLTEVSW